MAVPVVASVTSSTVSTTASKVINKPSGVVAGDLIVVSCSHKDLAITANSITGFTKRATSVSTDSSGDDVIVTVFDRVADGTEGASFTIVLSASTPNVSAYACRITGADPTAPFHVSATWANNQYELARRLPSVTTTVADCLLVAFEQNYYTANDVNPPTGWTTQINNVSWGYLFSKSAAVAGATGNTDTTSPGDWDLVSVVVLAYKPGASSAIKTANKVARASIKTINRVAIASVKSYLKVN